MWQYKNVTPTRAQAVSGKARGQQWLLRWALQPEQNLNSQNEKAGILEKGMIWCTAKETTFCWVSPECHDQHVIWFDSNKGCIGLCRCLSFEMFRLSSMLSSASSFPSSSISSMLVIAQCITVSQWCCLRLPLPLIPASPPELSRVQLSLCCRHFWSSPTLPWILH